jgi:hypothetical protein
MQWPRKPVSAWPISFWRCYRLPSTLWVADLGSGEGANQCGSLKYGEGDTIAMASIICWFVVVHLWFGLIWRNLKVYEMIFSSDMKNINK